MREFRETFLFPFKRDRVISNLKSFDIRELN